MNRFDIAICNLNPNHPTEAGKQRPVVILSDWKHGAYVAVVPIGGNADQEGLFRISVGKEEGLKKPSWVLVDQFRAVHRSRLMHRIGRLSPDQSQRLEKGLRLFLGLI